MAAPNKNYYNYSYKCNIKILFDYANMKYFSCMILCVRDNTSNIISFSLDFKNHYKRIKKERKLGKLGEKNIDRDKQDETRNRTKKIKRARKNKEKISIKERERCIERKNKLETKRK